MATNDAQLDLLLALEAEVERQGGARLPDTCTPVPVRIRYDDYTGSPQVTTTCGCGHVATFVIPYKDEEGEDGGFVRFCAYCDTVGSWPRFAKVFS